MADSNLAAAIPPAQVAHEILSSCPAKPRVAELNADKSLRNTGTAYVSIVNRLLTFRAPEASAAAWNHSWHL